MVSARDFAKRLADVVREAASLRLILASQWTGPDLDFTISEKDALNLRDNAIVNGLPPQFFDVPTKLGFDRKDQDSMQHNLIIELSKLSGFNQIRIRDSLMDAKLRAAEIGIISVLEQFSRCEHDADLEGDRPTHNGQ